MFKKNKEGNKKKDKTEKQKGGKGLLGFVAPKKDEGSESKGVSLLPGKWPKGESTDVAAAPLEA